MIFKPSKPLYSIVLVLALVCLAGCQNSSSKGKDDAKTFTPTQKQSAAPEQSTDDPNKALNSPAETVNGKASPDSDRGSANALKGQAVAQPGAPVEHDDKPVTKPAPRQR